MPYDPNLIGPPDPNQTPPSIEEILGLTPPTLDETQEPGFQQGGGSQLLEGLAGLNTATRAPRTFAEGLVGGFSHGLGSAGSRIAAAHQKFDQAAAARSASRDAANRRATEEYRQEKNRRTYEYGKEQRTTAQRVSEQAATAARDAANQPLEVVQTPQGPRYVTRATARGMAPGEKPAGTTGEPLVAIETPNGPRYVKRADAVGATPVGPKASVARPPTAGERTDLVTDIDILGQVQGIRDAFKGAPGAVGPVRGAYGAVASRVGLTDRKTNTLRSRVAGLRNQILKARSGGAVTEGEAARLLEELPVTGNASGNFVDKLDNFERTFRRIAEARREVYAGTGVDVSRIPALPSAQVNASGRPPAASFWKP